MPIIDNGDGTFKYIEEQRPAGLQPPHNVPNVSPINEVRAEVSRDWGLTPQAVNKLYNTSTEYRVTPSDQTFVAGEYANPMRRTLTGAPDIMVQRLYIPTSEGKMISVSNPAESLMHEFAHKWYWEEIPRSSRGNYKKDWRNIPEAQTAWRNYGDEAVRASLETLAPIVPGPARESYAQWAEQPNTISEANKNLFYPGLFTSWED